MKWISRTSHVTISHLRERNPMFLPHCDLGPLFPHLANENIGQDEHAVPCTSERLRFSSLAVCPAHVQGEVLCKVTNQQQIQTHMVLTELPHLRGQLPRTDLSHSF